MNQFHDNVYESIFLLSQALHFCYGFGAFISPIVAEPFLLNEDCSPFIDNTTTTNDPVVPIQARSLDATELPSVSIATLEEAQDNTRVRFAFWIMAAIQVKTIELNIRTRGGTDGDASCTNAMGPRENTRAILHARRIGSRRWSLCLLNADAILYCQLTKWPHKHTLSNACLSNLKNGRLRACWGMYIFQCALKFLYITLW